MRRAVPFVVCIIAVMVMSIKASGEEEIWSYDDESGDVQFTNGTTVQGDDIDIVSLTLDHSRDPLVVTMRVEGEITEEYGKDGADGSNSYWIGMDLDGDENSTEIAVEILGNLHGSLHVCFKTPYSIEPLGEKNYTINGSIFTARIDRARMGSYSTVLDFSGYSSQMVGYNNGFDHINYNFGADDKPYEGSPSNDNDDTTDGYSDNEFSGSILLIPIGILMGSILAILAIIVIRKWLIYNNR